MIVSFIGYLFSRWDTLGINENKQIKVPHISKPDQLPAPRATSESVIRTDGKSLS